MINSHTISNSLAKKNLAKKNLEKKNFQVTKGFVPPASNISILIPLYTSKSVKTIPLNNVNVVNSNNNFNNIH